MSRLFQAGILALTLCGLLVLSSPAMAEVVTFAAGPDQISSTGVLDIAENPYGDLFFGTDNGLSVYNGSSWRIIHRSFTDPHASLLSDHVLAVEFDGDGTLWMGFPNGLERLEGGAWVILQDQQLLKSLDIHGILRRGREMWVSAGNAGLHRYLDGTWTWFQPGGPEGLGCNYITDMATDPATGTFYAACREGIWFTDDTGESIRFSALKLPRLIPDPVRGIHGDPFGGLYVWNASAVLHFTPPGTWRMVLTSPDLLQGVDITDLQVGADRILWVATNNGIYGWRDGAVRDHLDTFSGIGNNAVKRVYLDSAQRLWFVTADTVGYATMGTQAQAPGAVIPITTFELPTTPVPAEPALPELTPAISVTMTSERPPAPPDPLTGFLQGIQAFLKKLTGG